MVSFYYSLVANGLYWDLLSACILVPIMHLMATRPLLRVQRTMNEIFDHILDRDTTAVIHDIRDHMPQNGQKGEKAQ